MFVARACAFGNEVTVATCKLNCSELRFLDGQLVTRAGKKSSTISMGDSHRITGKSAQLLKMRKLKQRIVIILFSAL